MTVAVLVAVTVPPGEVTFEVTVTTDPPGPATVVVAVEVTVLVEVEPGPVTVVVLVPQALTSAMEPTVAPPTIRPASFKNSRREIVFDSFTFSSSRTNSFSKFETPGTMISYDGTSFNIFGYSIKPWCYVRLSVNLK